MSCLRLQARHPAVQHWLLHLLWHLGSVCKGIYTCQSGYQWFSSGFMISIYSMRVWILFYIAHFILRCVPIPFLIMVCKQRFKALCFHKELPHDFHWGVNSGAQGYGWTKDDSCLVIFCKLVQGYLVPKQHTVPHTSPLSCPSLYSLKLNLSACSKDIDPHQSFSHTVVSWGHVRLLGLAQEDPCSRVLLHQWAPWSAINQAQAELDTCQTVPQEYANPSANSLDICSIIEWTHLQTKIFFIMELLPLRTQYQREAAWYGIAFFHIHPVWMEKWDTDAVMKKFLGLKLFGCSQYTELLAARSTKNKQMKWNIGVYFAVMFDLRLRELFMFLYIHRGNILFHDAKGTGNAAVIASMCLQIELASTSGTAVSWQQWCWRVLNQ